jgi:hypothetical protein
MNMFCPIQTICPNHSWLQWTGGRRAGVEGCQGVCRPSSRSCLSSACAWCEALHPATRALFCATARVLRSEVVARAGPAGPASWEQAAGHATDERGAAAAAVGCAQCNRARVRPLGAVVRVLGPRRGGTFAVVRVLWAICKVPPAAPLCAAAPGARPGRRRAADASA